MLFDEILATLRDNGKSGAAYGMTVRRAEAAMREDPDRAIGYRLLVALAERFLDATGRLAVTTQQTDAAFRDFEAQLGTLQTAFAAGDPAGILGAVNEVALASRQPLDIAGPLDG